MENSGSAAPVFSKDGAETPSEYRFVYDKDEIKKLVKLGRSMLLSILILCAILVFYPDLVLDWNHTLDINSILHPKFEYQLAILIIPASIIPISYIYLSYYFSRLSITFGQEGITSTGFWSSQMPPRCAWSDLSKIRKTESLGQSILRALTGQRRIIFIRRSGHQYILSIGSSGRTPYVGVGHSLSIEEVLERFAGPIQDLGDTEKTEIPALRGTIDLGREVGHVAYAALGFAVLAGVLMILPDRPYSLDNAFAVPLYWTAGLCAGALACWYMWRIEQKVIMIIPVLLLGGVAAGLLASLMWRLPMLMGTPEQLVFKVTAENEKEQRWQAAVHPELILSIDLSPDRNLVHQGVGAEQTLTIYRGPGPLNAMRDSEYRTLYRLVPPGERASASAARKAQGIDSKRSRGEN